jgi:hypothetical protein
MRFFLTTLLSVFIVSCGALDPRLDTSSEEAYTRSLSQMREPLNDVEREELGQALVALAMQDELATEGENAFDALQRMANLSPEQLRRNIGERANGKTAREIIRLHHQTALERTDTQIAVIEGDLAESEALYASARSQLDAVNVQGARFYWAGRYFLEPVISLSVTNNGTTAISRIYFHGKVETPGRTIPWIDEDFNYVVVGGLEPGETRRLSLSPNRFGEWGASETQGRRDLVFTVTVVDIEGPNGERLLSLTPEEMTARREHLAALRQTRAELLTKLN